MRRIFGILFLLLYMVTFSAHLAHADDDSEDGGDEQEIMIAHK